MCDNPSKWETYLCIANNYKQVLCDRSAELNFEHVYNYMNMSYLIEVHGLLVNMYSYYMSMSYVTKVHGSLVEHVQLIT